jgi:thiol-disulfide isomerase/thioredoxin
LDLKVEGPVGKLLAVGSVVLLVVGRLNGQAAPVAPGAGSSVSVTNAVPVAETPATATPQLSPEAAYDQAVRPLEIVRRSMANWSDSEVGAFAVAMKNAGAACAARAPGQFAGDELIAYAKLCSLGQNWAVMGVAAGLYIDSNDKEKPQLATAYGYKLESKLHAQDVTEILSVERSMLRDVPYEAVADTVTNEALAYLQLAYTNDALTVHAMREPLLVAALKSEKPGLPRHVLYADGLAKAALEQYAKQPEKATATVAELDAALDAGAANGLAADDAIPVEASRRQYGLLGKRLPEIQFELSLKDVREKPHINPDFGAATALLLFPDWCAQCVRMAPELWDAMTRLGDGEIRVYGLVAEAMPDKAKLLVAQMKPMGPVAADAPVRSPSEVLLHTPVLVVPPETLTAFAASDYPFLIVVDHEGVVRFAAPAPESVLQPGDFLDTVVEHVAEQWPRPKAAAVNPKTTAKGSKP